MRVWEGRRRWGGTLAAGWGMRRGRYSYPVTYARRLPARTVHRRLYEVLRYVSSRYEVPTYVPSRWVGILDSCSRRLTVVPPPWETTRWPSLGPPTNGSLPNAVSTLPPESDAQAAAPPGSAPSDPGLAVQLLFDLRGRGGFIPKSLAAEHQYRLSKVALPDTRPLLGLLSRLRIKGLIEACP